MTEQPAPPAGADGTGTLTPTCTAAWPARDWSRLRAALIDDVNSRVSATTSTGQGGETVHDMITWFDLITTVPPRVPTANRSRIRTGKTTVIRATFDPRAQLDSLCRAAHQPTKQPADGTSA